MPPIEPHKLRWLQLQLEEAEERERAILGSYGFARTEIPEDDVGGCGHGSSDAGCLASMPGGGGGTHIYVQYRYVPR